MKGNKKYLGISIVFLAAGLLWTVAVRFIDVGAIGPLGSKVGFSTINGWFHRFTGVHLSLYEITDWIGLTVPIGVCAIFGTVGLVQWITRKRLGKVDYSLRVLGGFYLVTIGVYLLFENVAVNYRPVLIDGGLEPSYPSSTTLLVLCVMLTAILQLRSYIRIEKFGGWLRILIIAFMVFVVIGRILSGVHWITDIIGGVLFSVGMVSMYRFVSALK